MKAGLLASGLTVVDVGVLHSPGLYFSVFHLEADGGVMITASHNPAEDNGFKIVSGRSTIYGAELQRLRARVEKRRGARRRAPPASASSHDILTDYVDTVVGNIRLGPRPIKVVVDGGNGTGGLSLLPILRRLGVAGRRHLLRARRPLPAPPPGSRPSPRTWSTSRAACARPAPRSAWRSTATATASAPSTARGASCGATSW